MIACAVLAAFVTPRTSEQDSSITIDNVGRVLTSGVIKVVSPLLPKGSAMTSATKEMERQLRDSVLDLLGSLSNHPDGKMAIAESAECLGGLVNVCKDDSDDPDMQVRSFPTALSLSLCTRSAYFLSLSLYDTRLLCPACVFCVCVLRVCVLLLLVMMMSRSAP